MIYAKVIADSISEYGVRLTTLEVRFNRFILPEFNTHRVFSRNFSSSRAIPTERLIAKVRDNPAMPIYWGKNQAGMQARAEIETPMQANDLWRSAALEAANAAQRMHLLGVHKQLVNRLLEPFLYVTGIVSSTDFDHFFGLRDHPDAQPEIQVLARVMKQAISESEPKLLRCAEWHLPYVKDEERKLGPSILRKVSAARCCRVSYLKHDGSSASIDEDVALCDRLLSANPIHASPFEHQATPDAKEDDAWINVPMHGNFEGWMQYRKLIEIFPETWK